MIDKMDGDVGGRKEPFSSVLNQKNWPHVINIWERQRSPRRCVSFSQTVRGTTDPNRPAWPSTTVTTCMSYLKQEVLTSYHQPEESRKVQKERGDSSPYVLPTSRNPSLWNPSWLSDARATRKDPESE